MDLARLEFTLRPRGHWEAIDLGFALARRWFVPLCTLWLVTALPFALLLALFFHDNIALLSFLLWWGKPLYEPLPMFWLSRAVFGEQLPVRAVARDWWRIARPGLLTNLTLRRLGSSRSFTMPVALLEGLKGKERRGRIAILGRNQQAGTWLTIVGIHFETLLEIGFLLTLFSLLPEPLRWFDVESFFLSPGIAEQSLQFLSWLAAMAIIAPFYVAAGFSLYLHRRSELEGWDIEINFRRTVEKLAPRRRARAGAIAAALFALCLSLPPAQDARASEPAGPQQSQQLIQQVLQDPRFGRMEEQHYWKYVGQKTPDPEAEPGGLWDWLVTIIKLLLKVLGGFMQGTASFFEVVLWALGLGVVAYLLYHFSRNAGWMHAALGGHSAPRRVMPTELFGLDVRPDSLPEDIAAAALARLRAGELRPALSLLYRGSLMRLITAHQLEIPASATEGECLQLVERQRSADEAEYFARLTRLWLVTAYAQLLPEARQVERLCLDWQQVYGHDDR